jgi:hypothetical protein
MIPGRALISIMQASVFVMKWFELKEVILSHDYCHDSWAFSRLAAFLHYLISRAPYL